MTKKVTPTPSGAKSKQPLIILAILSVSIIQMGTNAISPIMADLARTFPQAQPSEIQFLMTFPSLMVIVFGLLAGVLSRSISRRLLTSVGCIMFASAGVLSWLFHDSLIVLFIWSGLMGTGLGISVPIALSCVNSCIVAEHRQNVMGWVIGGSNLGAMAMTFIGGLLASIHWNYNYLVYLIAVPGIFLTLLYLPGEKDIAPSDAESEMAHTSAGTSAGISTLLREPAVVAACAVALLSTMLFNIVPTNLAMLLTESGHGSALQAGTGTTLMLASGAFSGLLYGRIAGRMRHLTMTFAFAMIFLGQLVCALAPNLAIVYLGCLITGLSQGTNMAYALMLSASHSHGNSALSASIVTAIANLGGFCTPLVTILASAITGNAETTPRFLISSTAAAVIAIVITLLTLHTRSVNADSRDSAA